MQVSLKCKWKKKKLIMLWIIPNVIVIYLAQVFAFSLIEN